MGNAIFNDHQAYLMSILLDGKDICLDAGLTRKEFDTLIKTARQWTLDDLYDRWKALNKSLVSGRHDHFLMDSPKIPYSVSAVRWCRQVYGLFTRLEGLCDAQEAISSWKSRVYTANASIHDPYFREEAAGWVRRWLGEAPLLSTLRPKHGPGSVATGEKGRQKWRFSTTYTSLTRYFERVEPQGFLGVLGLTHLNLRHLDAAPNLLTEERHAITKLVAVPKDMRKVRIISCEPLTMQYLQQGILREIVKRIERRTCCIHFSSQDPNRAASRDLFNATLDMSDASDLVSRRLVHQLFPESWRNLLFATRSTATRLPDGTVVPLRSFAPMGSAVCFPVEAIIFASITCAYLVRQGCTRPEQLVHVFGDDIIVPNAYAAGLINLLESIGMRPNREKCCYNASLFRESCGAEWFRGEDVTVQRPRNLTGLNISVKHRSATLPMVGHARAAAAHGYLKLAQHFADLVNVPVAIGDRPDQATPLLKWKCVGVFRYIARYQQLFQRHSVVKPVGSDESEADDWNALAAHLICGWRSSNLGESGRKRIAYVWSPVRVSDATPVSIVNRIPVLLR